MKLLLGILLVAGTVFCIPGPGGNRYHAKGSPKTTLKSASPGYQPRGRGTASQDPLAQLVKEVTPVLKTLGPILKSLAPALKKLGPVLLDIVNSLLPPTNGTSGTSQQNPLGSLVNNLLTKPNPIGNLVGGLLGKPAGTPLIDSVGSVVSGLTGARNPAPGPNSKPATSVLGSVGPLVGRVVGGASSAPAPLPVRSVSGRVLGGTNSQVPSPIQPIRSKYTSVVVPGESCESSCPYHHQPVCSTSGGTYGNACMLRCSGETFGCNGECPCGGGITKPHRCPCNPYEYDPVCTVEGEQINNRCLAICQHKVIACSSHCPC